MCRQIARMAKRRACQNRNEQVARRLTLGSLWEHLGLRFLKYLQIKSSFGWSLSHLAALLRQQLFIFRDLWAWLNAPWEGPPATRQLDEQLPLAVIW